MPDMASGLIQRFPPSASRWVGVAGIAVIVVVLVLMVVDGLTLTVAAVAAGFALFGVALYLALVRPTMRAYTDHLLVRNLVSDTLVPWHLISDVEVRQTLRVYTRDKVVHAVALGHNARQQMRANLGGARGPGGAMFGMGRAQSFSASAVPGAEHQDRNYVDFVTVRILQLAESQRQESSQLPSVVRRWAYVEIGALVGVGVTFVTLVVAASS